MNRVELKKIRKQSKMSQAAFGKALGVSSNTIYQWESSNGEPRGGWDGADLKKKLKKIDVILKTATAPKVATTTPKGAKFAQEALEHTLGAATTIASGKSRSRELPQFVQALASVLLSTACLGQVRYLLLEAKQEGLDLDRLLALLGIESS